MSFLKGFCSLFDWIVPRSMEDQLNDLDDSMQKLYDKMGWGAYKNPLTSTAVTPPEITWFTTSNRLTKSKRDPARPRVNKYL